MLDQPTQVFYPSDVEIEQGLPAGEETRLAVRRLYTVMRDFVAELDGGRTADRLRPRQPA